ncbi:MAG: hypothetical protein IJ121_10870 [Eubacterium sp.]|nr:hypothetical protein [Eubacterium sp.]
MEEIKNNISYLNNQEAENVAGGSWSKVKLPEVELHTSGSITLHSTPENIVENEVPDVKLYRGDIVLNTGLKENGMTYVLVKKNGRAGWVPTHCLE